MPNWCENDLTVQGQKERVLEFLAFARSDEQGFDFSSFIPYPEKFRSLDEIARQWERDNPDGNWMDRPKDGFNQGGYEWCVRNWGTKWNAGRVKIDEPDEWHDEMRVEIHFDTAWSPPRPVIEKVADMFPDLDFDLRYFESGMSFHGVICCQHGEPTRDEQGPYYGRRGG